MQSEMPGLLDGGEVTGRDESGSEFTRAVVRDFIRILQRRGWRGRLLVLPVKVQGEGAAAEMAEMLRAAEELGIFELLVIGRGGGSLEDLWAFNEEILVRAVAACGLP